MSYFEHLLYHIAKDFLESKESNDEPKFSFYDFFSNKPYDKVETDKLLNMSQNGDSYACLDLSNRYCIGHGKLSANSELFLYWREQAIKLFTERDKTLIGTYFKQNLSTWFEETDDDCCTFLRYIENRHINSLEVLTSYSNNFHIPIGEEILFSRDTSIWSDHNQGVIITSKAIYYIADNNKMENMIVLYWDIINNVKFDNDNFTFNLSIKPSTIAIGFDNFFKGISKCSKKHYLGCSLAKHLSMMARMSIK